MDRKMELLAEMAGIRRMCRGRISARRQGKGGGLYYAVQLNRDGENTCRYIRPAHLDMVREATDGYARFKALAEAYADIVIEETNAEMAKVEAKDGRTREVRSRKAKGTNRDNGKVNTYGA